jgi:hypothetical protein
MCINQVLEDIRLGMGHMKEGCEARLVLDFWDNENEIPKIATGSM